MSENNPPPKPKEIKVPPAQVWREFRMRFLPIVAFVVGSVAAFYLWNVTVVGPTMIGEVEGVQASVISPDAGYVTNLLVRPYQMVKAGDPVAEIVSTDVSQISSLVQDWRSRVTMSQIEIGSMMDQQKVAFDYQSLNMNTLRFRADLSAAKAELPALEAAYQRAEQGWKEQVVPYNDYEAAVRARDSVRARVQELERLVSDAEAQLKVAAVSASVFTNFVFDGSLTEALKRLNADRHGAKDSRFRTIVLRAPITGTIGTILRRPGENIMAGNAIATIYALEGDRIVTYLRPGMASTPKRGASVNVRCRTHNRDQALGKVEEIGLRYESITNTALIRPGAHFELGMPISIAMPASLRPVLRPGELVDLDMAAVK